MNETPTPSIRSDEELVTRVLSGDTEAFGELVARYDAKLKRYGRSFLANPADIEDLVQDAFLKAYENIRSFDTSQRFSPWMYRIAHNTFVNRLRANSRSRIIPLDLDTVLPHIAVDATQETEADTAAMRTLVGRGMEKLDPKYREVLALHYFEDLSYKEIAQVLRIPTGTVGIRLVRARDALKRLLPDSDTLSV